MRTAGTPKGRTGVKLVGRKQGQPQPTPQLAKQTCEFAMQLLGDYAYRHHKNGNWAVMAANLCQSVLYGASPPLVLEADRAIIMGYIQQACEHTGYVLSQPKKRKKR